MTNQIATPWAGTINTDCPLPEYPRPQLVRPDWRNLNGIWTYCITKKDSEKPTAFKKEIVVPFAIESTLSGVKHSLLPDERIWYRRCFKVPEEWREKRIILHFEAVDWQSTCYVNGQYVGEHTGGYVPFSFDLSGFLNGGENEIILSVWDPTDSHWQQKGKQVLNPIKFYYTATSGIWQTVWLEAVAKENHIVDLKLTPDLASNMLGVIVNTRIHGEVEIKIFEANKEIASARGPNKRAFKIPIPNPICWSPDNPFLYDMTLLLYQGNQIVDMANSYFGMRSVSIEKRTSGHPRIILNQQPLFLHGPLDQGYWPESGMTPSCEEAILFDLQKIKEMGFNMIRKHVKVETRRWYYHADRLGLVVIQDMINGGKNMAGDLETTLIVALDKFHKRDDTPRSYHKAGREASESRRDYERELIEVMDHLHNTLSLLIWVPFNESWGQFDSKRIANLVKKHDPTRLVDHASGWFDQGAGDFLSRHRYVLKLKKPPPKDKRAYFISEYGGYSFLVKDHLWDQNRGYKYRSFQNKKLLEKAYQKLIEKQVMPLIKKGLGAAVYTQLSDVEIECNGFFTYDRKVQKLDPKLVRMLNERLYQYFKETESLR